LPHRLFLDATVAELAERFAATPDGAVAAGPGAELASGQPVPAVVGDRASSRALVAMRWGLIPMGRTNARGRPVLETIVNARGETLFAKSAFAGLGRCLVPAGGWFEWTGTGRKRLRWTIRAPGAPVLAIAAVWDRWRTPGGGEVASLATVTVEPNPEVAAVHDRMPAILPPEAWPVWLGEAEGDPAALLAPLPEGMLVVAPAP
jgi:putative SOS response-associated peptidase YedK